MKEMGAANTDDESLNRQVHEQLASNPALQNVQITVKDGVVTLDGTVAKKEDKKEAKRLAKAIPGVKNVHEKLTVSESSSASMPPSAGMSGSASATPGNPGGAAGEASQSGIAANAGSSSNPSQNPSSSSTMPSSATPSASAQTPSSSSTLPSSTATPSS